MKRKAKISKEVIQWKHGEPVRLPIDAIEPNPWNPNEMSSDDFNMLSENVNEVDFLDPILVVPLPIKKGGTQRYRIVDGEHRWEQQRLMEKKDILCIIGDPKIFDEKQQMRQTVRFNKIRGHLNIKKFAALANAMMEEHGVPFEELAHEFGFTDETELEQMLEAARETLPSDEAKKEFDKAKGEIKTIDDLANLLNKLFSKYGDTLPGHFMILDFGGKEHIWVRVPKNEFRKIVHRARSCMTEGVTFDSVVCRMLMTADLPKFIKTHRDFLEDVNPDEKVRVGVDI